MTIDQIIAHELLGLRSVCLPFVGTLYAHRVPVHRAERQGGVGLLPPGVEVSLDGGFSDDRSIIVLLQGYFPQLDSESATLLYNRWVEQASSIEFDTLVVEGVCRISTVDFSLSVDPATTALLHTGRTLSLGEMGVPSAPVGVPARRFGGSRSIQRVRVWPALLGFGMAAAYIFYTLLSR